MKNKLILSSVALVCAAQAFAYVEKSEVMTIEKADGTTIQYTISDLDRVSFGEVETQYALYIEKADGEQVKLQNFPKVFLAQPSADGNPYEYGFSFVDAATPEEVRQGDYAIQVSVSALKMNEDVDLAGGAASGVTVALYSYADGEVDNVWDAQTEGSFSMSTNAKNGQVTMTIEATFEDGTTVDLVYKGKPTAADDMIGLNPPFEYKNQGEYFNKDGNSSGVFSVESIVDNKLVRVGTDGKQFRYLNIELSNYAFVEIYIDPAYIGQKIDFSDAPSNSFKVTYGYEYSKSIDLASPDYYHAMYIAKIGSLLVDQDADGKFTVDLDVTNRYDSYGSVTGSLLERVIFNLNEANL